MSDSDKEDLFYAPAKGLSADAEALSVLEGQYVLHQTIGSGGFAKVKLGTHILTGERVAIKIMDKHQLGHDLPRAYLEVRALKVLCHQHICKLYQVIETTNKIILILEYCPGGELFDYIVSKDRLDEEEARFFFRQIVAAVAYIHSQGFAHRDLKPENMLLDEENRVKLIDFGLCAQPEGGMNCPLETCCGSPAYAAPELIRGSVYLGAEADVWSLGVLLYALLCGFLPFDDDHIPSLYQKIQIGMYEKPNWLSPGAVALIDSMLQTTPIRRITVRQLLHHPWLRTNPSGFLLGPIQYESNYQLIVLDEEVLEEMSLVLSMSPTAVKEEILHWKYDYVTALYFMLMHRKIHHRPLHLRPHSEYIHTGMRGAESLDALDIRKLQKDEKENKYPFLLPVTPAKAKSQQTERESGGVRMSPGLSMDSRLNELMDDQLTMPTRMGKEMKKKGTGVRIGRSIEKGLDRMKNMLTPSKKQSTPSGPTTVKALQNVSTTSSSDPDQILRTLLLGLIEKGISCKQHGYKVRGKADGGRMSFELEVVRIPGYKVVGIKRKRLNGDAWCYKKVCEQVLALTGSIHDSS
ncbi:unnamed protein product [Darwinula stevensoni]|uniref:non-specific serine/threonine protein kinase n=1 Tax=Darwinula stevensoni TaxID=69355 RepID=A0A7R8XIB3_9CRUS|nr:unnamed protein product [Darwinula stevensoni]CAG0893684.1 unnamed protein product [Darwinula stevensoni]